MIIRVSSIMLLKSKIIVNKKIKIARKSKDKWYSFLLETSSLIETLASISFANLFISFKVKRIVTFLG